MLSCGKYKLPIENPPSTQEKLNLLIKLGYPIHHLFGTWYLGRTYPYKAAKFAIWIIINLK